MEAALREKMGPGFRLPGEDSPGKAPSVDTGETLGAAGRERRRPRVPRRSGPRAACSRREPQGARGRRRARERRGARPRPRRSGRRPPPAAPSASNSIWSERTCTHTFATRKVARPWHARAPAVYQPRVYSPNRRPPARRHDTDFQCEIALLAPVLPPPRRARGNSITAARHTPNTAMLRLGPVATQHRQAALRNHLDPVGGPSGTRVVPPAAPEPKNAEQNHSDPVG